tara:strand:- start:698 stop:1609 length:912 start_codon:yes stop_codon:yes gene_type:complete
MTSLDTFITASKKMLFDKLELDLDNNIIHPIVQNAISSIPFENNRNYNKLILKYVLDHFKNHDSLDNAVLQLDIQRNQSVLDIPIPNPTPNSNPTSITNPITNSSQEPYHISLNLPKNNIPSFKTISIHSILRNISDFPFNTFFSFSLPPFINLIPHIITFDTDPKLSFFSLTINDNNGKTFSYDFWPHSSTVFHTIHDLEPISTQNNNTFTLGLYTDYKDFIQLGLDNILITNITIQKNNYIVTFEDHSLSFDKFFINNLIFTKNSDNTFSCNLPFNVNDIINSKCIPILHNQFHLIFKQFL